MDTGRSVGRGRHAGRAGAPSGVRLGPDAEVLVECPRCGRRAVAHPSRVICAYCGYLRDDLAWRGRVALRRDGDTYTYRGLRLWLQTACRGQVLWAYDAAHLDVLEWYVRAYLRDSGPDRRPGPAAWIREARRRRDLLGAIGQLRDSL
jgi:hypothetical protein